MKNFFKLLANFVVFLIFCTSSNSQELHTFNSKDPFNEKGEVETIKNISVVGTLHLPIGNPPYSAVILSNSSSGTGDKIQERLILDLKNKGYAVFAIQSFTARGIVGGVGSRQSIISFQSAAADTLSALRYLRTQSTIKPDKICAAGHSRGGSSSFNFAYFTYFLDMIEFEEEPFNCNISINTAGYYKPKIEKTTAKPALIFIGELDDVWFMDMTAEWYNQLIKDGNPIQLEIIKDSYHGLTSRRDWCPQVHTSKGCREFAVYDNMGISVAGKRYDRVKDKYCLSRGYYCGYGNLDKYPEMFLKMSEFLEKHNR